MMNFMDAAYTAVMAVVAHCLGISGLLAPMRKLSSQLSHEGIESSGLFSSFELLGLRLVWVEVNGVDEAPIACRA